MGWLGQARRLCHWGPLVALAVVAVCSATAMADAALWYWPLDTAGGSVNFIMLLNWTVMILYNYFSAMFVGPGYVPLGWTPVSPGSRSIASSPGRGGPAGPALGAVGGLSERSVCGDQRGQEPPVF
ncbi:palmitoyltransferase zdhhc6 [Limosa lapponica baueri]|uniref:Palmitoyltransferase zdhhc6 n=1 Tax=Limosa lapponica baueri TaxID=1758121 RepID=A0A2I0T0W3_LIMLA|nr:palmitoyltransferase zdhhc6 [Limosa lapponica baueri]